MQGPPFQPSRPGPRLLRALVLAGSGVALGSLAHVQGHGTASVTAASVLLTLFIVAVSWAATAQQVTWTRMAGILGCGQVLTHLGLSAGHDPTAVSMTGHLHHPGTLHLPAVDAATPDLRMLVAHVLAWAVLTALFTAGERALWRWLDRLLASWPAPTLPALARVLPAGGIESPTGPLAHRLVLGRAPPA